MARWMHQCEYHDKYEHRNNRTNMALMMEQALGLEESGPLLTKENREINIL